MWLLRRLEAGASTGKRTPDPDLLRCDPLVDVDADDALGPGGGGFELHPLDGDLARLVHGGGMSAQLAEAFRGLGAED